MLDFRHLALFFRFSAANSTGADLVFKHRIVGGTGAAEFIAGHDMTNIDQDEGYPENRKNDQQCGKN